MVTKRAPSAERKPRAVQDASKALNPSLDEAVRWLLQPESDRPRRVLARIRGGAATPAELKADLEIEHDPQLHRVLEYLDDYGLLDRYHDTSRTRRGAVYKASPLGVRALELAERVDAFLREHAKPA